MPTMDTSTEQPSSMVHVRASTMYPPPVPADSDNATILLNGNGICTTISTVEGSETDQVPFPLLCGEGKLYTTRCVDGALVVTNYRLYMENGSRVVHVPLGLIELLEVRDLFYLHVWCKDARSFRCTFETNEQCAEMFRNLSQVIAPPRQLLDLFAFRFYAYASEREHENIMQRLGDPINNALEDHSSIADAIDGGFRYEVERLGFDLHGAWRISQANVNYRLCSSYPPQLLVPACITDDTLETVARFRSSRRVPAVVWRHSGNGAVIARCSQPEVGWLGWRSSEDEDLLKAIADACAFDKGPRSIVDMGGGPSAPHTPTDQTSIIDGDLSRDLSQERPIDAANLKPGKKVLIMDARSYTTAVANRARGGGCECPEYYPSCDIQFMNLANIHSIRKSFHALRQLCSSAADQLNWWSMLEGTRWLQHMSGLMRAATTLAAAVERDARPALVHCSDGWDRTPQIVALAELLLDPYYRTIEGFRVLVEREWLAFGHKFADRCGHSGSDDPNERCPVFLQWLDCIHQLLLQFPCSFQFVSTYLVKLAQHTYSNLFGTFLCNTKQERVEHVYDKTFSVWRYLNAPGFKNHLYAPPPTAHTGQVLWPACNVRDLKLWSDVYLGMSFTSNSSIDVPLQSPTNGHIPPSLPANSIPSHRLASPHSSNVHPSGGSCASVAVANGKPGATCINGPSGIASNVAAMTKTRSYGDLIGAAEFCPVVRRCSDPSITVDSIKMSDLAISSIESDQSENSSESDLITNQVMGSVESEAFINREIEENINIPITSTNNITTNTNTNSSSNSNSSNSSSCSSSTTNAIATATTTTTINENTLNNYHHYNNVATTNGYKENVDSSDINHYRKITTEQLHDKFPRTLEFENNWMKTEFTNELLLNLAKDKDFPKSDINHNGELNCGGNGKCDDDSDNENDRSESKSEVTVCNSPNVAATIMSHKSATSNETSTDTLVAENGIITGDVLSSEILEGGINGTVNEPIQNGTSDGCEVCAQNRKLIEDKQFQHSRSTSGKNSRYSTPPPYTRTPSRCGAAGGGGGGSIPGSGGNAYYIPTTALLHGLDVDGLVTIQSEVQHRLWQLQEEHRIREEALQHDLHKTRMALIKQVCHNCNHNDADKPEDTNSLVGSVCSTNDGQISGGDSLPSDLSWEALDEGPSLISGSIDGLMLLPNGTSCVAGGSYGASRTLWVPDHAVSRCTGCQTEFWLGRRKHHCRNCGRIFCADCSENSTPLPNEHLYNPVRVCTSCYAALRRNCPAAAPELTDKCKHSSGAHAAPPAANAQLTASSN